MRFRAMDLVNPKFTNNVEVLVDLYGVRRRPIRSSSSTYTEFLVDLYGVRRRPIRSSSEFGYYEITVIRAKKHYRC
jgi:hypothetical protein